MENCSLWALPNEMLIKICSYLPLRDQLKMRLVSKSFKELMECYFMEHFIFEINEENIEIIKELIEAQKIRKNIFKRLHLVGPQENTHVQTFFEACGEQVEQLEIHMALFFPGIEDKLKNLKSLKLNCFYDKFEHVDLSKFSSLEKLHLYGYVFVIDELLGKLVIDPKNTLLFKELNIVYSKQMESNLLTVLIRSAATLNCLKIHFADGYISTNTLWEKASAGMTNLKCLCFRGHFVNLYNGFYNLPATAPLKHIIIDYNFSKTDRIFLNDSLLALIVNKWKNSLQALELKASSDITDEGFVELKKISKLRLLSIESNSNISFVGVLKGFAAKTNPFMEELNLSDLDELDELCVRVMLSQFPNLRVLKLDIFEKSITNTTMAQIFGYLTKLRVLYIEYCGYITDGGLLGFGYNPYPISRLKDLEELNLGCCHALTDRAFIEALKLPKLRKLEIDFCENMTTKGVKKLVKNCPLLEYLRLPDGLMLDRYTLRVIGRSLKNLRVLGTSHSDRFITLVQRNFKSLQRENAPIFSKAVLEIHESL